MPEREVSLLSREELEAEVRRLRERARSGSMDAARQNAVFDSALDFAIVVTDRQGTITGWNSGSEHVMGWTAEEMRGQDAARFFTPEDRANGRVTYEMETALKNGRAQDERWHLKQDEERFWASGEMMPLRDEEDRHIGFVKIIRDRTGEHLAGVALRAG
ncbi:PAS domain-containing protein [Methylobacterium ajmalii]|uniref:PAS domain-containing protein n=1 Tax=Methylobacterium ajmalii TaxID=2738439 RepID=A0ABU9ZZ96_9HYPH